MSATKSITKSPPSADDQTAIMAAQLSGQYQKALAGLIEQIKFGAMVLHLQANLDSTRGIQRGQIAYEGSLKQWLETNCPEVSIPTAWRWMSLAKGIKEHFQLGVKTDIAALLSDSSDASDLSAKHQKLGEKLRTFLAGKSATQLMFDFRIGVPDPKRTGGYRGPGEPDTRTDEEKRKEFLDNVRRIMGEFFLSVNNYIERSASWKELSRAEIQGLYDCLQESADTVKEHINRLHK